LKQLNIAAALQYLTSILAVARHPTVVPDATGSEMLQLCPFAAGCSHG